MIGIALSQFANAIASGDAGTSNGMSAVFSPRQAPRFEGANGERISLPTASTSSEEDEDEEQEIPVQATKNRMG